MKTVTSANNSHFSRSVTRSMQHQSHGSRILGAITLPADAFWGLRRKLQQAQAVAA